MHHVSWRGETMASVAAKDPAAPSSCCERSRSSARPAGDERGSDRDSFVDVAELVGPVSEFAKDVAHQANNRLFGMLATIDAMDTVDSRDWPDHEDDGQEAPELLGESLEIMREQLRQMARLNIGLQDYFAPRSPRRERVDLLDLLRRTFPAAEVVDPDYDGSEIPSSALVDPHLFERALCRVVAGVQTAAGDTGDASDVGHSARESGSHLVFSVRSPRDQSPRVELRVSRSTHRRQRPSSGFSRWHPATRVELAVALRDIESMGGSLAARSAGAEVRLELPAARAESFRAALEPTECEVRRVTRGTP